jgi:hypothetical protein
MGEFMDVHLSVRHPPPAWNDPRIVIDEPGLGRSGYQLAEHRLEFLVPGTIGPLMWALVALVA